MKVAILSSLLLSGCLMSAQEARIHNLNHIRQFPTAEICDAIGQKPSHAEEFMTIIRERGQDCDWNRVNAILAATNAQEAQRQRESAALLGAGLGILNANQRQQPQMTNQSARANCFFTPLGAGYANLRCN